MRLLISDSIVLIVLYSLLGRVAFTTANEQRPRQDEQQESKGGGGLIVQTRPSLTQFHRHRKWLQELLQKLFVVSQSPRKKATASIKNSQQQRQIHHRKDRPERFYDNSGSRRMADSTAASIAIYEGATFACNGAEEAESSVNSDCHYTSIYEQEPHVGMQFTISTPPHAIYELVEAVNYQLGDEKNQQYTVDYAYSPVQVIHMHHDYDGYPAYSEQTDMEMQLVVTAMGGAPSKNIPRGPRQWWQWWRPMEQDERDQTVPIEDDPRDWDTLYQMQSRAFAGGSHGEVWRGRRRRRAACLKSDCGCDEDDAENEPLIFKRLRIEHGYRVLEAGLREIHFGRWLAQQASTTAALYTQYVDHFFRTRRDGELELWIVFRDAGPSLRSYLYTAVSMGEFVFYQPSDLWTRLRMSVSGQSVAGPGVNTSLEPYEVTDVARAGRKLMRTVLKQILEAAAHLHEHSIVHRDIKPSNVLCITNMDVEDVSIDFDLVLVKCALGDLSSAWDEYSRSNLYTRGPSRLEQTDDYAPPEAIFGYIDRQPNPIIEPSFDSWSIGVLALEMLLGTPNVFSVDQRTTAILTHKLTNEGTSKKDIQRALYLAALSQFCIFHPSHDHRRQEWPLRRGDPLHQYLMVKSSCTLHDFHRGLLARDPLGLGFDTSVDPLLHLIWQLLSWDPKERITASEALRHPYFTRVDLVLDTTFTNTTKALESQMLDPRMDFNLSDSVEEFHCPQCGRVFDDWNSCLQHARSRRHAKFCTYDRQSLPTCLHAHSMLPVHNMSGYCDIQGRRRTIEDFHSIHLTNETFYYGIFDGHSGNLAAKFVASALYCIILKMLNPILHKDILPENWKIACQHSLANAFAEVHHDFLEAILSAPRKMDQSGTTATIVYMAPRAVVLASLGDSRAVLGSVRHNVTDSSIFTSAVQLTKDHVASDSEEQQMVESRGGHVTFHNGMHRVNGTLAITRSIGDAALSPFLSREPHVVSMTAEEVKSLCASTKTPNSTSVTDLLASTVVPCFLILASDGLWDVMSNEDAVDMVAEVLISLAAAGKTMSLQEAAERLTLEAYVRGSRDNIGVAVIAI
ncbi:hypothetical protein MPSEU_001028300 [Mayamaea pseudoterrestris]|nr:hypothetical protein MPSEU_001028300 [Mayamaea pseudoterrestris]